MNQLVSGITLVMDRKDTQRIIILSAALLFAIFLAVEMTEGAGDMLAGGLLIVSALGSFIVGINLSLAYAHVRRRSENTLKDVPFESAAMLRACLGSGRTACGIVLFSTVLGFIGFVTMLSSPSRQGEELGHVGLIILLIATCALAQKVTQPNV